MRAVYFIILFVLAVSTFGQELPFLPVTGPNAPAGFSILMPDTVRGGLWMGVGIEGNEGLVYFDGSHFVRPLHEPFPKAQVYSMAEDTEGGIWLTTGKGLYRAFRGHIELKQKERYIGLYQVAADVFLTAINGSTELLRLKRSGRDWKVEAIAAIPGVSSLVMDAKGTMFYTYPNGYAEFRGIDAANWKQGQSLRMSRHGAPQLSGLDVIARDSAGCWWGRRNGYVDYECPDGTHASQPEREQISGPGSWDIFERKDGSIVVAQYAKLSIGRPHQFRTITAQNGYPGAVGWAVTRDGSMWFSNGNGLFVFPTKLPMECWTEHEGLDGNTYSVVRTAKQTLAIAGSSLRMLTQDRTRWAPVPGAAELPTLNIVPGEAWKLTSDGGVSRRADSMPADGWTCTPSGLKHNVGGWKTLSTEGCSFAAVAQTGDVWYAGNGFEEGFTLLEKPGTAEERRLRFESGGEIGVAKPRFLGIDKRGWIWRGTPVGVYVADAQEAREGRWLYLNKRDGLGGTDANQHSFFGDPDGSVWFGIDNSVNHLWPPADFLHPSESPDIFVSGYSLNGGEMMMADMLGPVKSGSDVTAHVGSLQFDRRNALRIRYRVLPEQTAWRESKNLDLALGVLAAGEHTVEVQGRLFTGPWSVTARSGLQVLRPVWMTGPYLLTYLVALFIAGMAFELLRRRRALDERLLMPDIGELRMAALLPEGHELTGLVLDGRFEVGKVLARGGFATVLEGYDRMQQRRCAIKVFRGEVKSSAPVLHGFAQEVRALRQIRHESVVAIYADGVTKAGAPFVAMEFIEGKNLRDILRGGPLTEARTGQVLAQLASALDAIHSHGICHRDVKPENVIVRAGDGVAVLIDFSIAIIKDVNETMHGISRAAGTFDYMAPEQALGYAEPASDVFSLAKLVLELLCGKKVSEMAPNAGLDLPQKVPELLRTQGVELSEEAVEMLARALEFDPKNRPRAASEFARPITRDLGR